MDYFLGKKILVTGAHGYLGSSLVNKLRKINCELYLLSRKPEKSEKNVTEIKADITEKGVWKKILPKIDIVFHFAAQTSSAFANDNPFADLRANLLPIVDFVATCKKYNYSPDFIFSGTVTEVGFTKKGVINEKNKDLPITVYDINKLAAEKYLQYYAKELNGRATTLRLPNIYGPGQASSRADRGIVNLMIKKALLGESLSIFGTGKYLRDYLFIDDAANAFLSAAKSIKKTGGKYYVLGTDKGTTILQMAKIIVKLVKKKINKDIEITFKDFPPHTSRIEFRNFIADSSAFRQDTGWQSAIILQEGIRKTIEFFLKSK